MFKKTIRLFSLLLLALCVSLPSVAEGAWPTTADWNALPKGGGVLTDIAGDAVASRDIIGDASNPAAYTYSDGDYIYYRIRLNDDPYFGTNNLKPFGWGFLIDTDSDFADYEWLIMVDGIGDEIYLAENTTKTGTGDPSDKAEVVVWSQALDETAGTGNFAVTDTGADIDIDGTNEFFLDFRIPFSTLTAITGITNDDPIRYFVGSSNSAQTLTTDLVGTDLFTDLTDPVTAGGIAPTTGTVAFVADISGSGDVTAIIPGDTIYVKVIDNDQNQTASSIETIEVIITTPDPDPDGDYETITLTETGIDTGIFTGSITTSLATVSEENANLEVSPVEVVTVTYTDVLGAAPGLLEDQDITDTLTANHSTDLSVTKTIDDNVPDVGDTVEYTITLTNDGPSTATGIEVTDTFPVAGLTYVSDTSDGGAKGSYNDATGLWTVASLASGNSTSFKITADVIGTNGNTYTNSISITFSEQTDPVGANDSASVSLTVGGVDLEVEKTVDDTNPQAGGTIEYTLTVTNNSTTLATDIEVTDSLDADLTFVSASGDGTYDPAPGTEIWSIASIAGGGSASHTITATVGGGVASGTVITNTATITSVGQADPETGNDTASQDVIVGGADLEVTKTVDDATPDAGDTIVYTIIVTNNGDNSATGVVVTDSLPTGVTWSSDDGGGDYVQGTGVWTVGALNSGISATLKITVTVDAGTAGQTITNSASVTATETDPDSSNDTDSIDITVTDVDLSLVKTVDNTTPAVSDNIVYTLTVTNNGPDSATGVVVTDALPADVSYVSDSSGGVDYDTGTDLWTIPGTIASLDTASIDITVTVDSGTTITNTASITSSDQEDLTTGNDSDSVIVYVGATDLSVTKTVDDITPASGGTITYTVTLTNLGPGDATGIEVTDALPTGVSHSSDSADQGSYNQAQDKWTVGDVANGVSVSLYIVVDVDGSTGDIVVNTARLEALDQGDPDITNDVDSATIYIGGTDLSIAKTVDDASPTEGDTIEYELIVTNLGANSADSITISDPLPSGVTWSTDDGGGDYDTGTGVWTVPGTIASLGTATLTITATVDAATGGSTITNTATITGLSVPDTDSSNDTSAAPIVVQSADLYVVKTVSDSTPTEGDTIVYTLSVTNDGPQDTTGVTVTDALPAGVTYVSNDGGGAYDPTPGTEVWTIGAIAKNSTETLNITVTVDLGTGGTTVTNTASITTSDISDPDSSDDSQSRDINPVSIQYPSLMMMKTVQTINDPYDLAVNPIAIPGATAQYTITSINSGPGVAKNVVITDDIPANTKFCLTGLGAGDPIIFTDGAGTESSGLTYTYVSLNDAADDLVFYDGGGVEIVTVTLDADGCDTNVARIEVSPSGDFNAKGATDTTFSIKFDVMVQ